MHLAGLHFNHDLPNETLPRLQVNATVPGIQRVGFADPWFGAEILLLCVAQKNKQNVIVTTMVRTVERLFAMADANRSGARVAQLHPGIVALKSAENGIEHFFSLKGSGTGEVDGDSAAVQQA